MAGQIHGYVEAWMRRRKMTAINPEQRYMVSIEPHGKWFMSAIAGIIDPSGQLRPATYDEKLNYIFTQSIEQMFIILDSNIDEYLLRLASFPEMGYFRHVSEFNDPGRYQQFVNIFKEMAYHVGIMVNRHANKENADVDYMLEQPTRDFLVILKIPKNYQRYQ